MNQSSYAIGMLITLTALTHSAAQITSAALTTSSKTSMHDFIGFTSRTSGSCAIVTPAQVEPDKDFPIAIVYSEMPELQNKETLSKITTILASAAESPIFSRHQFKAALQKIVDECTVKIESPNDHVKLNAVILCIKLAQYGVFSFGCSYIRAKGPTLKHDLSAKIYDYQLLGKEMTYAEWKNEVGHFEYDEPLTESEQEHADSLLQKCFFAKFVLVLDVAKFRKLHSATTSHTKDH